VQWWCGAGEEMQDINEEIIGSMTDIASRIQISPERRTSECAMNKASLLKVRQVILSVGLGLS
jgi:hypothetical protein